MSKITVDAEKGKAVVVPESELNTITAPKLEKELEGIMDSLNELVLDFSNVEYMSSAGLRVVLGAHQVMKKKGGLKIINVSEIVMEAFEVTGLLNALNFGE